MTKTRNTLLAHRERLNKIIEDTTNSVKDRIDALTELYPLHQGDVYTQARIVNKIRDINNG